MTGLEEAQREIAHTVDSLILHGGVDESVVYYALRQAAQQVHGWMQEESGTE